MTSTIPFGATVKPLTVTQEAVITTLYLAEIRENLHLVEDQILFVSGQYFIHTLGIVFESYHRKLMRQLEKFGWIRIIRSRGTLYYCLTESARLNKAGHFRNGRVCTIMRKPAPF